ncbi:tRNA lysidine(34) synthetase TilS [Clostridium sp. MB40-C1]|uniref:tRNA lysidine(34) synthetase TilS n=1 Tax=Clostridium sp. MB40-C1 TaxID=3070996 RepID=UPI0027E0D42E|nr:tRNA lysidine(34) synthetase TilS [Clostridium sp. MB40-C1]WMJ80267.1 tRNA lysidine(34) synthetase TilS [Clostridium sp. MB40-C1]
MIEKIMDTIKQNKMFKQGDKVIVGVSGGPDSICLLHVLYTLKEELRITLAAAHINHCLRGEEANKDEEYVKEFCNKLGIECFVKKVDVHKISKEKGISCEMAGREVRYEFFEEILKNIKGEKIAIAHNANDQAETVLMRIMRGTGLEGLVGIKAVRDEIYVRPILNVSRKEIEDYCEVNKLNPRIDKTNLENIFTRNKIRLELIPYIQQNFNKDIIEVLNRMSDTIRIDNEYINKVSIEVYRKYCKKLKNKVIIYKEAFQENEAIVTRIIRIALNEVKGDLRNFEKVHICDIIDIQKKSTGKVITLPNSIEVLNNYGDISLHIKKEVNLINDREYPLEINKKNYLEDLALNVSLKVYTNKKCLDSKKNNLIKYFDYDKIDGDIKLRYRKNGDKFTPLGMKGNKKLKDLFMDLKIPKDERNNIPLICFKEEIAWIVDYRVSDKFKIDENTKNILQIKIEGEE